MTHLPPWGISCSWDGKVPILSAPQVLVPCQLCHPCRERVLGCCLCQRHKLPAPLGHLVLLLLQRWVSAGFCTPLTPMNQVLSILCRCLPAGTGRDVQCVALTCTGVGGDGNQRQGLWWCSYALESCALLS